MYIVHMYITQKNEDKRPQFLCCATGATLLLHISRSKIVTPDAMLHIKWMNVYSNTNNIDLDTIFPLEKKADLIFIFWEVMQFQEILFLLLYS